MKHQSGPTLNQPQPQALFQIQKLLVLTVSLTLTGAVSVQAQRRLKTTAPVYVQSDNEGLPEASLDRRIRDYNTAITFDPKSVAAHYNRARLLEARGYLDAALVDYTIQLWASYAPASNNRALIYFSKGRLDEAITDWNRAIQLDRRYADDCTNRWSRVGGKGRSWCRSAGSKPGYRLGAEGLFSMVLCQQSFHVAATSELGAIRFELSKEIRLECQRPLRL